MKKKYTPAHIAFLKRIFTGRTRKEVTRLFNERFGMSATDGAISCLLTKQGLRNGHCPGVPRETMRKYRVEHLTYLRQIVPGTPYKIVLEKFNNKFGLSIGIKALRALCKKYHIQNGFTGCFPKGHIPQNKGRKGYCAPGSEKGWFKPGTIPGNYRPVGSERINVDGYVEVKVSDTAMPKQRRWRSKHVVIWEKYNNCPVPKGHAVIFADKNKRNFKRNNLVLVTRAELAVMNHLGLSSENAELTKIGKTIAELKIAVQSRKRGTLTKSRAKKLVVIDNNGNRVFIALDTKTNRYVAARDTKHGVRQLRADLKPRKTIEEARTDLIAYALKRGWHRT